MLHIGNVTMTNTSQPSKNLGEVRAAGDGLSVDSRTVVFRIFVAKHSPQADR